MAKHRNYRRRVPAHVLGGSKRRGRRASWLTAVGLQPESAVLLGLKEWAASIQERCIAARAKAGR